MVSYHLQRGYVLVTSLIFLLMLTLIAITAMDMTTVELRISNNTALKSRAIESSEGLRTIAGDLLDAHTFHRGWPDTIAGGTVPANVFNVTLPSGLTVTDTSTPLYNDNAVGEDIFDPSTLVTDLSLQTDGNSDGDFNDDVDTNASVSVYKLNIASNPGSGTCQVCGYEGTGKSSAAGGVVVYYNLRSSGSSAAGSTATTVAEYRHVLRN